MCPEMLWHFPAEMFDTLTQYERRVAEVRKTIREVALTHTKHVGGVNEIYKQRWT